MEEKESVQLESGAKATLFRDETTKEVSLRFVSKTGHYQFTLSNDEVHQISYLLEFWAPTH